jgi:hypothetical protein
MAFADWWGGNNGDYIASTTGGITIWCNPDPYTS